MYESGTVTSFYDLSGIAGETIREEEAESVVSELDTIFESETAPLHVNKTLGAIGRCVSELLNASLLTFQGYSVRAEVGRPYEQFERNGVNYQSKIIKIKTAPPDADYKADKGFTQASIYLIGLFGEGQVNVSSANLAFGFATTVAGEQTFFRIETDTENESKIRATIPS